MRIKFVRRANMWCVTNQGEGKDKTGKPKIITRQEWFLTEAEAHKYIHQQEVA